MVETAPIERFLGPIDTATGAFGLLGLSPRALSEQEIDAALARMVGRVHSHRQGNSAEASEVILALHVAAAQLRDPLVQRAMLAQIPIAIAPDTPPAPTPPPIEPRAAAPPPPSNRPRSPVGIRPVKSAQGFQELAMFAIAHAGGWNSESRRRIAGIAHTFGLTTADLKAALAEVAEASRSRSMGVEAAAPVSPVVDEAVELGPPAPRWLILSTIATFICCVVLVVALVTILISRLPSAAPVGRAAASTPLPAAPTRTRPAPTPTVVEVAEEPFVVRQDLTSALATLRRASGQIADNPAEAARLAIRTIKLCAEEWVAADPLVVESVVSEVSSFLTLASKTETSVAVDVADQIVVIASADAGARAKGLREVVFATGLVARLSRDATASSAESKFRSLLASHSGDGSGVKKASFGAGAALALVRSMSGCEGCPDAARIAPEWIRAYTGLMAIDAEAAESALLDSLGALLAQPLTESTSAAIKALVPEVAFGDPGSRASARIIGWFEDRAIPMGTISVLAAELISSGVLPGAPLEVVVSASGSEAERIRVRDVLAARLGVPLTAPNRRTAERLQSEAEMLLGVATPSDPRDALALAARAAIVHQAAALKWVGRDADAEGILASATGPGLDQRIEAEVAALGPRIDLRSLTAPAEGADGQWALRYLQASHNEDERATVLAELRSATILLGPADADVLAIAALGPNPPLLRKTAQRTLLMHATNPFVLAAVTEMIPEAVATDDVADMLEALTLTELPDVNAEGFRAAAARATMTRLLSMLAPSIDRRLGALHEVFADAYTGIQGAGAPGELEFSITGRTHSTGTLATDETADAIRAALRRDAQRYAEGRWTFVPLAELDRRYAARAMLPKTGLDRFVVNQLALAEMLAYLVSAERPLVSGEAHQLLTGMEREHLEAGHPFFQILSAERCILSLWMLRFGAASPESEGGAG